jgi:catechol 2,3-dioxygenase-like lactoylglutathione lyase family enzyme
MQQPRLASVASFIALSLLFVAQVAWGQTPTRAPRPAIDAAQGAFFAMSVADLEASSRWYSDKLGLEVVMSTSANGVAVKVLQGAGMIVELVQHNGAVATSCAATNPALCLGAFKVGVIVKDLGKTLEKLKSRGVAIAFGPFPAHGHQQANAIIRDNAGNLIQFIEM